jgi:hypothetical protein
MKTITKQFSTLEQAAAYQWRLYGRYDYVRLVKSPFIGEEGLYAWHVR